jgi:hypothetical protein
MLQVHVSVHSDVRPVLSELRPDKNGSVIPKQIFTFWDSPRLPKIIELCLNAIRRLNPDWELRVLSRANLTNPPEPPPMGFDKLRIQHKADWLRLVLLKRYGGVWLDASVVPLMPVTSWVDISSHAVQGFETNWYEPDCQCQILENWGFAAPPASALLEAWHMEHERAITLGFENYQQELKTMGLAQGKTYKVIMDNLPYLSQHAAFMRVWMAHRLEPVIMHSSSQGPLWFVPASNYSAANAAQLLHGLDKRHCANVRCAIPKASQQRAEGSRSFASS